jgi:hypothetical protein
MRASQLRPTRRNPYDSGVADALLALLTSKGLLALVGLAASAPAAALVALDVTSLPDAGLPGDPNKKGVLLLVTTSDGTKIAWFHYKFGDWSQINLESGEYASAAFTEEKMQSFVDAALAGGGTVQNLGVSGWDAVAFASMIAAAAAPGSPVPAPPAWLPPMTEAQIQALPTRVQKGGGAILVVYSTDPAEDLTAWFHYASGDWSKVGGPADTQPGAYKETYLTEKEFAAMCASAKAVFYAGKAESLGSSYIGPVVNLAPVGPPAAVPVPAASSGPWGKVLPKKTAWKTLPVGMDSGTVLVVFSPNGEKTVWYHYSVGDWSELHPEYGSYSSNQKVESEFAEFAQMAAAVVELPGGFDWYKTNLKVPIAVFAVPPLASLVGATSTPTAAAPAAPAPAASVGGMSPGVVAALQALHAYIKGDAVKLLMTKALFGHVAEKAAKQQMYAASSGSSSAFDYQGTIPQRGAYLSKLADLGLFTYAGASATGKKAYEVTSLGQSVATAWGEGYSDPSTVGKAPKAPKAPKTAAAAAAAEVTAPVTAGPKSKQIVSVGDNLALLAPLIKEAASKVKGVVTDVGAGFASMMLEPNYDASVRIMEAGKNTVTLGFFADSIFQSEKIVTIAVPDAAGMVASTIAQAMVYFLVYAHESGGKVNVQPPPGLPDPTVVGGVPIVTGAELTTNAQIAALPNGSHIVGGVVRYYAYPSWDTYFKPVSDPQAAAQQGIVFPAPKSLGWPAVQVAPTLAVYSELPIGTLTRTDFSGGSVYAVRLASGSYEKIQPGTGVIGSTPRTPEKLVLDAKGMSSKGTLLAVHLLFLGKGKVEDGGTYKEWIEGKRIDNAEVKAQTASAQVEMLAEALGIDPLVAALFTTKALQAMLAQTGIPYMGSKIVPPIPATAMSPLLKKNPAILGGFRSNPERYRAVVRDVLRNPRPSFRDLQDAELLEAAGLPLHDCLPRKRNPADGSFAPGTNEEVGIIKAVSEALKAALGSGTKPSAGTQVGSQMDIKLSSMYGSGGTPRPETSGSLAQWLRYLVAARAAGLWKNYIDPGERSVVRGLSFTELQTNDPSQSLRVNADGLSQIETMQAAGTIGSGAISPWGAMKAWLNKQKSGSGWFRADVGQPWQASSDLTPPSSYAGQLTSLGSYSDTDTVRGWNTKQRIEGGNGWNGKMPYPNWAAQPWANVEGFCVDYHDPTFSKFTASEWSAPLWGYGTQHTFCLRANTRDPRFVLLPGSTISGGALATFQSEGAVVFVTVDEKPLKAEVILVHDLARLAEPQLWAWIRARPAYPTGAKPVGPAAGIAVHRNPAPATRLTMREVHAFLFPRAKWGPGAVRNWLVQRGMEGVQVTAAGANWRVEVYGSAGFYPGSIRARAVGDGVLALVGRPV